MLSPSDRKERQAEVTRLEFLINQARRNGDRDEVEELTGVLEKLSAELISASGISTP